MALPGAASGGRDAGNTEYTAWVERGGRGWVGGKDSEFVPIPGSRQSLRCLDAKTEAGTSCLFNKSLFIHSKVNHWIYSADIKKEGGGGQGFPSQCPYANSLATPGVDLEEGRVGHMLPMRWGWKPRAWMRSWPPSSNPHLQPPSQTIYLAEQVPQMSLLLITTRGRSLHSPQYLEAETTGNPVAFTLNSEAATSQETQDSHPPPPPKPREKRQCPRKPRCICHLGSVCQNEKMFRGWRGHTFALTLL